MFYVNNKEYRFISIFSEDLIDLYVVRFEAFSSGVPSNKFLFLTDLNCRNDTFLIISNIDS